MQKGNHETGNTKQQTQKYYIKYCVYTSMAGFVCSNYQNLTFCWVAFYVKHFVHHPNKILLQPKTCDTREEQKRQTNDRKIFYIIHTYIYANMLCNNNVWKFTHTLTY